MTALDQTDPNALDEDILDIVVIDAGIDVDWVGGDPEKGEIYGWASWSKRKGILALRNPSDQPSQITLDIGGAFELPAGAPQELLNTG